MPPKILELYQRYLDQGRFEEAYEIWSQAAENHLTLQLNYAKLPSKCKGKGKAPTFRTQTLAERDSIDAGAATEWRHRLSRLVRKCLELEARVKSALHTPFEGGTHKFALATKLHTDIVYSGKK